MNGVWTPYRPEPRMQVQEMQTYQAYRPVATHTRRASCTEVDCAARARGWKTAIDVSTPIGRRRANYIRLVSGRSFTYEQDGDKVTFSFPPGQRCFTEHRVNLDRPTLFLKWGGDWRAHTSDTIRMTMADWVDDQATTLDGLKTIKERG